MKIRQIALATALITSISMICTGCGSGNKTADGGEKPVLKILSKYEPFDPNTDPSVQRISEMTGYEIEYTLLPKENANEKLMLELASGNDYDLVRVDSNQFSQLLGQNALMPLDDLLEQYGDNIVKSGSERAWESARLDGKTYGMPHEEGRDLENPYGINMKGIAIRTDILDELGLDVPNDVDSLYETLKAIKEAKNIAPLTGLGGFEDIIGSGFDIPGAEWSIVDGKVVPRIKLPQTKEYVSFMSKLYKEGLIDPDWSFNTDENAKQKLVSGNAAMLSQLWFWDVPIMLESLKQNNPSAAMKYITPLNGSDGLPNIAVSLGAGTYDVIPKTSKHAEDAIKFTNLRSDPDTFVKTYIGEEGKHYEIKDGRYYPILPAFDELKNSSDFVGLPPSNKFEMWQARARKTPEMAEAYEELNRNLSKEMLVVDYYAYANSLPEIQKYRSALSKKESDFYIKAMTSDNPEEMLEQFIKEWESEGGSEMEAAMNKWYQENKW